MKSIVRFAVQSGFGLKHFIRAFPTNTDRMSSNRFLESLPDYHLCTNRKPEVCPPGCEEAQPDTPVWKRFTQPVFHRRGGLMKTNYPGIHYTLPVGHVNSVDAWYGTPSFIKHLKITAGSRISCRPACGYKGQVSFTTIIKKYNDLLFFAYKSKPFSGFMYYALSLKRENRDNSSKQQKWNQKTIQCLPPCNWLLCKKHCPRSRGDKSWLCSLYEADFFMMWVGAYVFVRCALRHFFPHNVF